MGNDLEEVTADLEGGAVLALDFEAREQGARLGQDDLLDFLCLFDVEGHLALTAKAHDEPPQE